MYEISIIRGFPPISEVAVVLQVLENVSCHISATDGVTVRRVVCIKKDLSCRTFRHEIRLYFRRFDNHLSIH